MDNFSRGIISTDDLYISYRFIRTHSRRDNNYQFRLFLTGVYIYSYYMHKITKF